MTRRPLPNWLQRPRKHYTTRNTQRGYDYYQIIYWATPPWVTPDTRRQMREIKRRCPPGYHVDHEVPLVSPLVCGLHVPWNLQYPPEKVNLAKSNTYWPDCPHEVRELFSPVLEPYQLRLPL